MDACFPLTVTPHINKKMSSGEDLKKKQTALAGSLSWLEHCPDTTGLVGFWAPSLLGAGAGIDQ